MVKIYQQPFAHAGTKQVIPDASDPQGFVSNEDGFTTDYELPDTDPNYKPIERVEFNGLMNMVTESLGEIQQFGFAKWQPITWPQGARVVEGGVVYRALTQTSQQPPHADWIDDMDALILGLGTAATRDATVGNADVTAGRLLKVGDLGSNKHDAAVVDFNELPELYPYSGLIPVMGNPESINRPPKGFYYHVFQTIYNITGNNTTQIAIPYRADDDGFFLRSRFGGVWSAWREVAHTGNILSTTGQSTKYPMTQKAVTDAINNSAIGVGQTWQDVTESRVVGTTYTNTTGKPIQLWFGFTRLSAWAVSFTINGSVVSGSAGYCPIIPPGGTYSISATGVIDIVWLELRQ